MIQMIMQEMLRHFLMKGVWFEKIFDCKCVTARLIDVKFMCERLRMCVMVAFVPCNDREYEVKDSFWRELQRALKDVDLGEKLCDV